MLFDWFTTIAQVVNFIILLVVLKYLLYDRVLSAIDRRRAELAGEKEDAENSRREAKLEAERYREQREEIEAYRDERLREARKEANERRDELLDEARKDIERRREGWQRSLDTEREHLVERISSAVGRSAIEISERLLGDLADESVQRRMVITFIRRLESMDAEKRRELASQIEGSADEVTIEASFSMDEELQKDLAEATRQHLGLEIARFEINDDLVAGIRLTAGGRSVTWSVRDYLADVATDLDARLSDAEDGS